MTRTAARRTATTDRLVNGRKAAREAAAREAEAQRRLDAVRLGRVTR